MYQIQKQFNIYSELTQDQHLAIREFSEYNKELEIVSHLIDSDFDLLADVISALFDLRLFTLIIKQRSKLDKKQSQKLGFALAKLQNLNHLVFKIEVINGYFFFGNNHILEGLQSLTNLESLEIRIAYDYQYGLNCVKSLGDSLLKLTKLTRLKLTIANSLGFELLGFQSLIQGIVSLNKLKYLVFDIGEKNITYIDLKEDGIGTLINLEYLTLKIGNKNQLSCSACESIKQGLSKLHLLKYLNLFFGSKTQIICKEICSSFTNLSSLESLTLQIMGFNNLSKNGAHDIANSLKFLQNLTNLILQIGESNFITYDGLYALADSISKLIQLETLKIDIGNDNEILKPKQKYVNYDCFIQYLKSLKKLKSLELELGQRNKADFWIYSEILLLFPYLKELSIINVCFREQNSAGGDIQALDMPDFQSFSNLKQITLQIHNQNRVNNKVINFVGEGFQSFINLEKLDLTFIHDKVHINEIGLDPFLLNISHLHNLTDLFLTFGNKFDFKENYLESLGISLQQLQRLRNLQLTCRPPNQKTDGYLQLNNALVQINTLKSLKFTFYCSNITNYLREAFVNLKQVSSLEVSIRNFDVLFFQTLKTMVNLTYIKLQHFSFVSNRKIIYYLMSKLKRLVSLEYRQG